MTTVSGLNYVITKEGNGEKPAVGTLIKVHYTANNCHYSLHLHCPYHLSFTFCSIIFLFQTCVYYKHKIFKKFSNIAEFSMKTFFGELYVDSFSV